MFYEGDLTNVMYELCGQIKIKKKAPMGSVEKCLGDAFFSTQYATHIEKVSKTTKMLE